MKKVTSYFCGAVKLFIVFSIAVLLANCNQPQATATTTEGAVLYSDTAMSDISVKVVGSNKRLLIEKQNTYYELLTFIDKQQDQNLLLKLTKRERSIADSSFGENSFQVAAHNLSNGKKWQRQIVGSEIDYSNKVLVAHRTPASFQQEDTYDMYSLLSGELLMRYTYDYLRALIPNTSHKRFFGYLSSMASNDKPKHFATVTYCGSDKKIQTIQLKLKSPNALPTYTPELLLVAAPESGNTIAAEGKTVILARANRDFKDAEISGFALQINFAAANTGTTTSVLLPVENDRVDVTRAQFDKQLLELLVD